MTNVYFFLFIKSTLSAETFRNSGKQELFTFQYLFCFLHERSPKSGKSAWLIIRGSYYRASWCGQKAGQVGRPLLKQEDVAASGSCSLNWSACLFQFYCTDGNCFLRFYGCTTFYSLPRTIASPRAAEMQCFSKMYVVLILTKYFSPKKIMRQ